MRIQQQLGQSLVEYVVLLALVTIVAVSIVAGIGQRSTNRFAQAGDAMAESSIAVATGGTGKGAVGGIAGGGGGGEKPKPRKPLFGD